MADVSQIATSFPKVLTLNLGEHSDICISSALQHLKNLQNIVASIPLKCLVVNSEGKVYFKMKSLRLYHKITCSFLNEPEDLLKILKIMPNLEAFHIDLQCDIRSESAARKIAYILEEVDSKIKSCSFNLKYFAANADSSFLVDHLKEKFKKVTNESGSEGSKIVKINF